MTDYLKSILNAFHDLLFVFAPDGKIEDYIATNHEDELILPKQAFIGKHHGDVMPSHVSKQIERAFDKLDQGKKQVKFDYSLKVKGETQWYNAVLSKIGKENKDGDSPRYLGAVRNITERKHQELLLQGILNTSPGGIIVLDSVRDADGAPIDFQITRVNKSAELLIGVPAEQLVGQKITAVIAGSMQEKMMDRFASVVETGNPIEFQYQHTYKQDEVSWFHSKVAKYRDGVVSTFMDITKQKSTEKELARKNKELQQLNRHKDKLFSVISHDLTNAVGGAQGLSSILLEDYEELPKEEILEYLKLLNKNAKETQTLFEDLLTWSKNQFQNVTPKPERVSLADLTSDVFDNLSSKPEDKEISLKNQVPGALHVHADANMVKTILRNLVANGIKFSHPGGKVAVQAEKTGDSVRISVSDEGVGMDREAQEKIMDTNNNYTTSGTQGEKGSGLGLDLCIDFVEMHGGTLSVDSEPGQGSTFTFTLPAG
ncbi:PAS domain S-box-containing protein [Fodinibius roseus]|uniref:histidine kinase n=1 Tax=Fodinibius roseus TaxID=1194090 RepID=A0A1M5IZG3_9BACT|nr:ATP-binding protein [Fodinibius roseus]SHG33686.1 PAS domain S-box-containing protein [Fodinibius roseus]